MEKHFDDHYSETHKTWNAIARIYEEKFMDLDIYDHTYNRFCELIADDQSRILDVGCGPGNITRYLLKARPAFKILGIDIAPEMIKRAQRNNPSADFELMDIRNIDQLDATYQGIINGFCLPFLSPVEAADFIKNAAQLLDDDGLLYLSFVEGRPEDSGFKTGSNGLRTYFNYHHLSELKKALKHYGFGDLEIFRIPYNLGTKTEEHTVIITRLIK